MRLIQAKFKRMREILKAVSDFTQRWLWDGIIWGSPMGILYFGLDQKIPGDWRFFKIWGFISRAFGLFENLGIFIPRIGDFLSPKILGRNVLGIGIFWGWGYFFVGWDISPKSTSDLTEFFVIFRAKLYLILISIIFDIFWSLLNYIMQKTF